MHKKIHISMSINKSTRAWYREAQVKTDVTLEETDFLRPGARVIIKRNPSVHYDTNLLGIIDLVKVNNYTNEKIYYVRYYSDADKRGITKPFSASDIQVIKQST